MVKIRAVYQIAGIIIVMSMYVRYILSDGAFNPVPGELAGIALILLAFEDK